MKVDLKDYTLSGSDILKMIALVISGAGFYFGTNAAVSTFNNYMKTNDLKIEALSKQMQIDNAIQNEQIRQLQDENLKRRTKEEYERGEYMPLYKQSKP